MMSLVSSRTSTLVDRPPPNVSSFAQRIHGWSWQAFPVSMGTAAVYLTLASVKEPPQGLRELEKVFFFLNIALFVINIITLLLQAILYPPKAWRLVTDPIMGIFVPLMVLSFATIIIGTVNYGIPSGHVGTEFVYILFWIYIAFAILTSFTMLLIWFNKPHELSDFTPSYAFLIFPLMLAGVVSYTVLDVMNIDDHRCLGVLIVGYVFQGLGFFMTLFYICIYIVRLTITGFVEGHQANGVFVACGPPGFTALALINLGKASRILLPHYGLISQNAGEIWYSSSVMWALLLLGLAIFFFVLGALPYWFKVRICLSDILSFWALTFPNIGWISVLCLFGDIFKIEGFYVLHKIMTVAICVVWLILFVSTIIALSSGRILRSEPEDVIKDSSFFTDRLPRYREQTFGPLRKFVLPFSNH